MDASDLYPEMLIPYDPRHTPLSPPTADVCAAPTVNICMNVEWWSHVSGVIARLTYRDAWAGTDDEISDAIQSIYKIMNVGEPTMGCGCTETAIPLSRIDENGHYQQSDDGGATWHDAPQFDPRNSIPRIPPYPPSSSDNAKCAYADSVINHFKEGFIDLLEEGQTVEEILGILTGITEAVFGPLTGPIGWIVPALLAISTAIVAFGLTAVAAAFTDTFWDDLRCLIFCNMNDDGSFTQAQLDAIYAHVPGGAITTVIIDSWIAAIGTTGMTNAAHLAKGSTSTDCMDCCPDCSVDWIEITGAGIGLLVGRGEGYVDIQAQLSGGRYYATAYTGDKDICCKWNGYEVLSGVIDDTAQLWKTCGSTDASTGPLFGDHCLWTVQFDSGSPFTIRMHFLPC